MQGYANRKKDNTEFAYGLMVSKLIFTTERDVELAIGSSLKVPLIVKM